MNDYLINMNNWYKDSFRVRTASCKNFNAEYDFFLLLAFPGNLEIYKGKIRR